MTVEELREWPKGTRTPGEVQTPHHVLLGGGVRIVRWDRRTRSTCERPQDAERGE